MKFGARTGAEGLGKSSLDRFVETEAEGAIGARAHDGGLPSAEEASGALLPHEARRSREE